MIEHYQVERYDEVTAKQMKEVGFDEGLVAYIGENGVSKDEMVLAMELAGDENMKVDALIGNIMSDRAKAMAAEAEVTVMPPEEPAV